MSGLGYKRKRVADMMRAKRESRVLAERERWPHEQLERWRQERLDALCSHAAAHSSFWRERLPNDPRSRVRLADLPTLDKQTLMESFDAAVTDRRLRRDDLLAHLEAIDHDALYAGEFRAMTTSGSSGLKGLFVYDRAAWVGILAQFFRYADWLGTTPRLPRRKIAAVGGAGPTHMTRRTADSIDIGLHRVMSLPVTMPIAQMVAALNEFQPDFMNAFPSVAGLLAEEQEAGRLRLKLEAMTTSSELRPPGLPDRIERAFGVRPADLYAMTEGLWGCECEERAGVHLFDDMTIVEVVDGDGRPVEPGTPGARLLVTNLFNRVQPLIRFEVSDVLTIDPEPCPCGRTLARVKAIDGRSDDVLEIDGVAILPMQFAVVTADPDVRQFQVVQRGDGVRVRVVLREDADATAARERLRGKVAERLSAAGVRSPEVAVEPCAELTRGGGGKLKVVVADDRGFPQTR